MPAAARHAKPKAHAPKIRVAAAAATTLTGGVAAFVFLQGGAAAQGPARDSLPVPSAGSAIASYQMVATVHREVGVLAVRRANAAAAARRRHLAAVRSAQQQPPAASPGQSPASGADAAHSALGICIRNTEEGGSYAWGPGNGGGAYQFLLSTWEAYGGAASEYGVAGPAYQDQIFDNAIAAGGASNWTNYDGC
jgi:hypothetical protein